ncbi:CARDB domain-containing protein [Candidatus Altiarchaeota archaeon]
MDMGNVMGYFEGRPDRLFMAMMGLGLVFLFMASPVPELILAMIFPVPPEYSADVGAGKSGASGTSAPPTTSKTTLARPDALPESTTTTIQDARSTTISQSIDQSGASLTTTNLPTTSIAAAEAATTSLQHTMPSSDPGLKGDPSSTTTSMIITSTTSTSTITSSSTTLPSHDPTTTTIEFNGSIDSLSFEELRILVEELTLSPSLPRTGELTNISFKIRNLGERPSSIIETRVMIDDDVMEAKNRTMLAPGEERRYMSDYKWNATSGNHYVIIMAYSSEWMSQSTISIRIRDTDI